jgi:hypothetical protein
VFHRFWSDGIPVLPHRLVVTDLSNETETHFSGAEEYCPVDQLVDLHHLVRIHCHDEPLTLQLLNDVHALAKQVPPSPPPPPVRPMTPFPQKNLPPPSYSFLFEMATYLAMERNSFTSDERRPILSYRCSLDSSSAAITQWLSLLLSVIPNYLPAPLSLRLSLRFGLPPSSPFDLSSCRSYLTVPEPLLWKLFSSCEYLQLISCTSPDFTSPLAPQHNFSTAPSLFLSPLRQLRILHSPHLPLLRSSSPQPFLQFLFRSPHFHLLDLTDSLSKNSQQELFSSMQGMGCCVTDRLGEVPQEQQEQRRWIAIRGMSLPVGGGTAVGRGGRVLVCPPALL